MWAKSRIIKMQKLIAKMRDRRPVLISGETGRARARARCPSSQPAQRRAVCSSNCGASPGTLKTSFSACQGRFHDSGTSPDCWRGDGGTLVFGRVSELPPFASQTPAFLETVFFRRPDNKERQVNVVCRGRQPGSIEEIKAGASGSIFISLASCIDIPPARQRGRHPLVVEQFFPDTAPGASPTAAVKVRRGMRILMEYDCPGNVGKIRTSSSA